MNKQVFLTSCLVFLAIFSSSSFTTAASKNDNTSGLKTEQKFEMELQKNINFRKEFGYLSDPELVRDFLVKHKESTYGMVLNDIEKQDFNERLKTQEKLPAIIEKINSGSSQKVGAYYIDQKAQGMVHIGFKDLSLINEDQVKSQFANPKKVVLFQTIYSEDELNTLHKSINESIEFMHNLEIPIVSVTTDIIKQKVIIGLEKINDKFINKIESMFNKDMIEIVLDQKVEYLGDRASDKYRAVSGGPQINIDGFCTNGFSAQDSSGDYYLITAGHCMDYVGQTVYQSYIDDGDRIVAYANRHSLRWGTTADAAALKTTSIKATSWISDYYTAQKYLISAEQVNDYAGLIVCSSLGQTNTDVCGSVTSTNKSGFTAGGTWITSHRQTTITGQPGDSGSPVYVGSYSTHPYVSIYGIVALESNGASIVAYVGNIKNELNISVLKNYNNTVTITRD